MNKYRMFYEQTIRVNNASWLAVSKAVSILKQRPRNPCKIRGSGVKVIIPTLLRDGVIFSKQNITPCFHIKTGVNFIISVHYLMSGIKSGIKWAVSIVFFEIRLNFKHGNYITRLNKNQSIIALLLLHQILNITTK